MISTIVGSDIPLNVIRSSGQELIIKFKSHFINGRYRMNNTQATFLMSYKTEDKGNFTINYIGCLYSIIPIINADNVK